MKGRESLPTVLLVDDSKELREMTAISLRELGFEVTVASGGADALALIEKEPDKFDIIVTDFAMPLVSGVDVIRYARNLRSGWPDCRLGEDRGPAVRRSSTYKAVFELRPCREHPCGIHAD